MAAHEKATHREDDTGLWARFLASRDAAARDALILRYVPIVHFVIHRLGLYPLPGRDYEDLVSHGLLGLIDAVDRFDPSQGTQFSTYATFRVRGKILDQLRALDWLSRGARRRTREVQRAVDDLWSELGRAPSDEELAARLQLDLAQLRQALSESDRVLVSLDRVIDAGESDGSLHEFLADKDQVDPGEAVAEKDLCSRLAGAIQSLPEREQMILSLYYHEELTLKEIGAVLSLSESRVCQLHARAVMSLRALLSGNPTDEANRPAAGLPAPRDAQAASKAAKDDVVYHP